jgi:hypothetical protein
MAGAKPMPSNGEQVADDVVDREEPLGVFGNWSRRAGLNRGPADYEEWRDGPSQMWPDFADLSAPIGYR